MKKVFSLFMATGIYYSAMSQIFVGASAGTFNVRNSEPRIKGLGPTLKLEYASTDRSSIFLDASYYNKEIPLGYSTITDAEGASIGEADTKRRHTYWHMQLGFKVIFLNDFSEKGFSFFLGGGIATTFSETTSKYRLNGYTIPDSKYKENIFGFHFNTGAQYNFDPIIVELKANFDLMTKPLVSEESYFLTGSRMGILIPLSRQ